MNASIEGDREKVTALADRVVAEYKARFPLSYADSGLAKLMMADPRNAFARREEVGEYIKSTYERARAAAGQMVLTPPSAQVKLEPYPDYQQASAPGGQYSPAAGDGSREATYYYRNVPADLRRASVQNVVLHQTLPGHHLQVALLAEHGRKGLHPIARLLFFSGPGEGWATYSEDFARELGLYDSDFEYIGGLMGSITPEDGMLPFATLEAKLDRWLARGAR